MGQHAHAVADQFSAVLADRFTMPRIFLRKFLGGGECQCLLFRHGFATRHHAADIIHRVHRVHGGRAGFLQRGVNRFNMAGKFLAVAAVKSPRACAKPYAAVAPIAPAPLTTMSRMAAAVSRKLAVATILNSCGSSRCSISRT